MREENDFFHEEDSLQDVVYRYERMIKKNKSYYFDVFEFEEIIEYYLDMDQTQEAIRATDLAINQHPGANAILAKKAQIYLEEARPIESLKVLNYLEKIETDSNEIFLMKGNAYAMLGNIKEAIRAFEKAAQTTYDHKDEVFYNIAMIFEQVNHFKLAIKYLEKAYTVAPSNENILFELAYCFEKTDNIQKSIEYYNKYLDNEPFSENVWYNLGILYNKNGDFEKAVEAYDFALAIDDEYGSAYFNKANTFANQDRYEDAIKTYREFLEIEPDHVQTLCYIGECYEKMQLIDKAASYYSRAVALEEDYADAWFGLGMIELYRENFIESKKCIEKAVSLDSTNSENWYMLGKVNFSLMQYDEAIVPFRKAIQLDKEDYEAWIYYSEIFHVLGDTLKSIGILEEALQYVKGNGMVYMRLASYSLLANKTGDAFGYIQLAIRLGSFYPDEITRFVPLEKMPPDVRGLIEKTK